MNKLYNVQFTNTNEKSVIIDYEDEYGFKRQAVPFNKSDKLLSKAINYYNKNKVNGLSFEEYVSKNTEYIRSKIDKQINEINSQINVNTNNTFTITDFIEYLDSEISSEDLFALKLHLFEKVEVQESDLRESRAGIRKGLSIVEVLYHYYDIKKSFDETS